MGLMLFKEPTVGWQGGAVRGEKISINKAEEIGWGKIM